MKAEQIKKLLCLLCLALGTVAMAQSETPSILDRVQNVDDPELAELIRLTIESRENLSQREFLEITRQVTLSYLQIKLLDRQIAEVSRKIKAETGPEEMRYELLLAKAELESKLMIEVANLRETMGIIPKHPFEEQPAETLNTWLSLNVIDERIHVLYGLKPFREWWITRRRKSEGLKSETEALDYIREQLNNKRNLPIRIDLYYTPSSAAAAQDLRGKIVSLAREANAQMQTEVRAELSVFVGSGPSPFFIRKGTISTLHAGGKGVQRPDGGSKSLETGVVEPNDLEQHILWRLTAPKNLPLKFHVEYDEVSSALARQTADKISALAKNLGLGEVVDVERVLVNSVPESDFLGRWQAVTKGDIQTIDIQPAGVCVFVQSPDSKLISSEMSVPGRWFLTPQEVFMDVKDMRDGYFIYRGHFDKKGNLVIERGEIYTRGSFQRDSEFQMIFKRVY